MFTENGEHGWIGTWHSHVDNDSMTPLDDVLEQRLIDETKCLISTSTPKNITHTWILWLRGQLKPRPYDVDFGLSVAGQAKVKLHSFAL
jgi:beta-glucosidase